MEEEGKTGKKLREENQGGDEAGPESLPLGFRLEELSTEGPFGGRCNEGMVISTTKEVREIQSILISFPSQIVPNDCNISFQKNRS